MNKTSSKPSSFDTFAAMGRAAMLPGMIYAAEILAKAIDEMRGDLSQVQDGGGEVTARGVGRPRGSKNKGSMGWPANPEERKAEMARRMEVRNAKKDAKKSLHPRNPGHPDHAAWLAKVGKAARKRWNSMSPAAKKERLKKMTAARLKPIVTLEKTA